MNKMTDQNGNYNFEGFTDLAEYCRVQMEKAPEHMKEYTSSRTSSSGSCMA
jgi:hypothetical protein